MRKRWVCAGILGLLICGAGSSPSGAGDSLYGKVTAVKRGDVVTFESGDEVLDLRLRGVELPADGKLAAEAEGLVARLVLGKNARMRFEGRSADGTMWVRLFTDDPALGIREVAPELIRAGLARRQQDVDFKYGELAAAEREAQSARRGLWATEQPR